MTIRRFCRECNLYRPFEKERINHILHLILTILTIGFWFPVWCLCGLSRALEPWRCRECGRGK